MPAAFDDTFADEKMILTYFPGAPDPAAWVYAVELARARAEVEYLNAPAFLDDGIRRHDGLEYVTRVLSAHMEEAFRQGLPPALLDRIVDCEIEFLSDRFY